MPGKDKSIIVKPSTALPPQQVLEEAAPLQGVLPRKQGSGLGGFWESTLPQEAPGICPQKAPQRAAIPPANSQELQDYFVALQRVSFLQPQAETRRVHRLRDFHWLLVAVQDLWEAGGVQACEGGTGEQRAGTDGEMGVSRADAGDLSGPDDRGAGAWGRAAEHHLPACSPTAAMGTCSGAKGSARSWSPAQGSGSGEPRSASR